VGVASVGSKQKLTGKTLGRRDCGRTKKNSSTRSRFLVVPRANSNMGCTSSKPVYRPAGAFSSPLSSGAGPKNTSLPTAASGSLAATSAPSVGVFPANSRAGLAVLKALVSYPLYDASRPVVAICRSEQAAEEIRSALGSDKKDRVQVRTDADMQDLDGCAKQFAGVGALFMHAPNCEDSHSLLCNAIDAAAKCGTVQHLVLLSMLGADTSGNALARQCREAEMRVESQPGMSFTHLRSGFFMENWLSSRQSIMTKGTFFGSFDPSSALPLVSMQDVGLAAATVLCGPAKYANVALHLTGPDALTGGEVAGAMSKAFGRAVTYSYIPGPSFEASLKALGVPAWQAVQMVERFELLSRIGEELASTDVWRVTGGVHTTLERFLQLQRSAFTQGLPPLVCVLPGRGLLGLAVLRALHGCRVRLCGSCAGSSSPEEAALTRLRRSARRSGPWCRRARSRRWCRRCSLRWRWWRPT
jgi:uncharacterized protein YbjT (DUF2867 family)